MSILVISIAIQVFLVIHIVRSGQDRLWIWIVLLFPLVGGIAYVLLEVLPSLFRSREGRAMAGAILRSVDPGKLVRERLRLYELSSTMENGLRLADALMDMNRYDEALALYDRAQTGLYANDPHIMLKRAFAHFGREDYGKTKELLDQVIAANPDFKSQEGHLLYAKTLDALDDPGAAREYEALSSYYPGPEPKYRHAVWLKKQGLFDDAQSLLKEIVANAKRQGRHYARYHREWIDLAKRELCD
ncbi:MAG TPA: hypothetical protein VI457_04410 [Methylococcaceae bacterium]|nr:hypothetical protein [Methylococcaceae bacterium]